METLFELPEPIKHETCRTCQHRQRWQFNQTVIQYCGIRKSNRTENGQLKIKCKTIACISWQKSETK
jgi:hypothetical protein